MLPTRSCGTFGFFFCSGGWMLRKYPCTMSRTDLGEMLRIHWACISRHPRQGLSIVKFQVFYNVQTESVWGKIGTFAWWNKLFRCFAQQLWKDWVFCIPNHSYIVLENSRCGCMLPKNSEPWSRGCSTKKLSEMTVSHFNGSQSVKPQTHKQVFLPQSH